jgi:hypothetical protein
LRICESGTGPDWPNQRNGLIKGALRSETEGMREYRPI